jgi:DNA-binding NarL/FixJ family response regulator
MPGDESLDGDHMNEPPIRVLIVDDIAETRDNIRKFLDLQPDIVVVGTAANGAEAIDLYDALHPDVVSMGIHMPVMDGPTATRVICSRHKDAKIFMLSVDNEPEAVRRAMEAGAKDFLAKPAHPDQLVGTVRRVARAPSSGEERSLQVGAAPILETKLRRVGRSPMSLQTHILGTNSEARASIPRELGRIALGVGNHLEAYNAFTEAIQANPLDAWAWLGKSVALSSRPGWEDKESEVYLYLTEALGLAENSTGLGTPSPEFATEFALRSEEITKKYSEAYCRQPLDGESLQEMVRKHASVWGVSPSEQARRLAAKSLELANKGDPIRSLWEGKSAWAEVLFDAKQHEATIRFYLSCAITLSWEVFPTGAGGCLIGELLPYWWMIRWKSLIRIEEPQGANRDALPSRDSEHLYRVVQSWLDETHAELSTFRQQLDSQLLPPGTRFTDRMAQWILDVLEDPRGYKNLILATAPKDLLDIAAALYPECASCLQLPLGAL